jgi:hypothetical protein
VNHCVTCGGIVTGLVVELKVPSTTAQIAPQNDRPCVCPTDAAIASDPRGRSSSGH